MPLRNAAIGLILGMAIVAGAAWADDRSDLLATEARWDRAVWEKDAATLATILADDFVLISADGSLSDKAATLRAVAEDPVRIDPFETQDVVVRVYGDVAVLTGHFTLNLHLGEKQLSYSYRYTDVYRRVAGRWLGVSAQGTTIRPAK